MAEEAKRYFPLFVDVERRLCFVVGEGPRLEKRVRQLQRYDADVVVITPTPSERLLESEAEGLLTIEQRSYVRGDLADAFLVFCLTDDAELRAAVFSEAERVGCLVNNADAPEGSNFILPSISRRGPLQIAVSTSGGAPEVAKAVRKRLDAEFGPEWGDWVTLLSQIRGLAMERIEDGVERSRVIAQAAEESVRERLAQGERLAAETLFEEIVASVGESDPQGGTE